MHKVFMGVRIRRLREERGLTQADLARLLQISASYLNQIEQNQRPLTVPVLLRLNAALELDVQLFAEGDSGRLIGDLRAALADQGTMTALAELRALTDNMPDIAQAIVKLHEQLRAATERADLLTTRLSHPDQAGSVMPFEAVRDWFYRRRNHVAELDLAAEAIGAGLPIGAMRDALADRLVKRHALRLGWSESRDLLRHYDPVTRLLTLGAHLDSGQQAFQMATQLAMLEHGDILDRLTRESGFAHDAAGLLRIGLANYFAGALILPYGHFLSEAERTGYDIDLLARRFGVGFETTCHRLSTLQREGARGIPMFFIRVDRAGNISKRQSATDFHFSRIGGTCPLWGVYDAFSSPTEIVRQISQMPDGRSYFWVARQLRHSAGGFGAAQKSFAIGLGCDLAHAGKLVYARGLDLGNPTLAVPIGPGCKVCDRPACAQRAFPAIAGSFSATPSMARFAPYAARDAE